MGSSRQPTLIEAWGGRRPSTPPENSRRGSRGRGGRRGGRGTRGGRGRGKGVTATATVAQPAEGALDDDYDDILCDQAMSNFELVTNDVSKGFQEVNASKELPGFDAAAGDIWIYPTNRPVRDYQFNIVKTALYNNTMVSLPTGLGKTFIAAVLMYNFHRWYPNSLIVFMAPTRPLVTQQLEACHQLMGIDPAKMIELTGQTAPKRREELWKEKKVFFLTPQVMEKDLARGTCSPEEVRCIVVDEAHKALGNHAFAKVVSMVAQRNKCFRVLALSATPGNDLIAVQQVLKNLLISRIELRSETSFDILPYTHQKQIETVIVPLDDYITSVHTKLIEVFQIYTGKLMKQNILSGSSGSSFTQYQLLKAREQWRQTPRTAGLLNYQKGYVEVDFVTCITLAHAIELVLVHGLRSFYSFLHGVLCKEKGTAAAASELKKNSDLEQILAEVKEKLNISAENSFFDLDNSGLFSTILKPQTTALPEPANPEDYLLSHPKMRALRDIVEKHFKAHPTGTRIMIFSEYRDSVQEIGNMLNILRPLVKPIVFLGQAKGAGAAGRGLRQKEQVKVIQSFRSGSFNVLVSTCVGEEGLDIGEVDLIICYDASKGPTRLVQRMGRTGRQREGKTIFLLTQGKEQRSYYSSMSQHSNISKSITDTSKLEPYLYKESPRMVPAGLVPQCYKMDIILSSEQRIAPIGWNIDLSDVEEIETDFAQIGQEKTIKDKAQIKLPKKRASSKKSTSSASSIAVNTNLPGTSGDAGNTIDKCFEKMQQRMASREVGTTEQGRSSTGNEDDYQLADMEDLNFSFSRIECETHQIGTDFNKHIKDLLRLQDVDGSTTIKCVFVPKTQHLDLEVPELNPSDLDFVESELDIECLTESLNAVYLLGPPSRCECGLVIIDDDMMETLSVASDETYYMSPERMDSTPRKEIEQAKSNVIPYKSNSISLMKISATPLSTSSPAFESTTRLKRVALTPEKTVVQPEEESNMSPILIRKAPPRRNITPDRDSLTPPITRRIPFSAQMMSQKQRTPSPKKPTEESDPDSPDFFLATPEQELKQPKRQFTFGSKHASSNSVVPLDNILDPLSPIVGRQYHHNNNSQVTSNKISSPHYPNRSSFRSEAITVGSNLNDTRTLANAPRRRLSFGTDISLQKENMPDNKTPKPEESVDSPDLFPPTPDFKLKGQSSKRKFTFRVKPSTAVVKFDELLSPPVVSQHTHSQPSAIPFTIQSEPVIIPNQSLSQKTPELPSAFSSPKLSCSKWNDAYLHTSDTEDDDFITEARPGLVTPTPTPTTRFSKRKVFPNSQASKSTQSESSPAVSQRKLTRRKRRRRNQNVFILDEVEVFGDESSDEDDDDSDTDLDQLDTFVTSEDGPVTETQMAAYIRSTNKTPERRHGQKKSLDQVAMEAIGSNTGEEYESDTFCVPNDEIEYEEIGDFTQRMDEARIAVQLESPSPGFKKNLRSKTRHEKFDSFKVPVRKPRKRVRVLSSDSE